MFITQSIYFPFLVLVAVLLLGLGLLQFMCYFTCYRYIRKQQMLSDLVGTIWAIILSGPQRVILYLGQKTEDVSKSPGLISLSVCMRHHVSRVKDFRWCDPVITVITTYQSPLIWNSKKLPKYYQFGMSGTNLRIQDSISYKQKYKFTKSG